MNYFQLSQAIQDYSENTEALFVSSIPMFVQEAEKRIYNSVQIPSLRKNVTGTLTQSNKYLTVPADWLGAYSIAVVDGTGRYTYLLNKDVNYMREAYPNPSVSGLPKYYALFGPSSINLKNLTFIVAPTPDQAYDVELHYFYYPLSIVQGQIGAVNNIVGGTGYNNGVYQNVPLSGGAGSGALATITVLTNAVASVTITNPGSLYVAGDVLTANTNYLGGGSGQNFSVSVQVIQNATGSSWLGDNYDPVLFYGAMREAIVFMKGEADMVNYYEKMFQEALLQLKRLGDGLERNDAYRKGQTSLEYNKL
jgi:hypothetical protein